MIEPIPRYQPDDLESWHPKLRRILSYWQRIHPPRGLPGRQHVDPVAIGDLLPGLWLLDLQREPFRMRYRLVGTRIVEAIGQDATGMWFEEAHPHIANWTEALERFRLVAETGRPSRRRGPALFWSHRDYREIENVVLPLAADGINVDMLMVLTVVYLADGTSR